MTKLTARQIADEKPDGWAHLLNGLQTRIATPGFAAGLALVNAIGAAAEEMDHHPDVDLRYTHVAIRLTSHDTGAVTRRDIRLARRINELAAAAGLRPESAPASRLEIALDTPAQDAVAPFWAAVLGGRLSGDEVHHPDDALPALWFQQSGADEPRQRWHLDLWLDGSQVRERIDAALAAGGTLVSDANAPSFWVLADAEGNRMCLCTTASR
nr:4a-hydroxytetrahydrobiopterin dehydratase [uncultured Actinoplanes sp.]